MTGAASSPLLSFYGDDFTGSTDVMEALTAAGVETVLFLGPPTEGEISRFSSARAFGIAGIARTMTPEQMEDELPAIFESLRATGTRFFHYKVCSTFDSSPQKGSIGRGTEIAKRVFDAPLIPMVIGAPALKRFQVFGNLFAAAEGTVYRLDRHPTMTKHPVTPMHESDLRRHLGEQTDLSIALVDRLVIAAGEEAVREKLEAAEAEGAEIVLFDVLTADDLAVIGGTLERLEGEHTRPLVLVGSSGIEYALGAHWARSGEESGIPFVPWSGPRAQTLAVSGSRALASEAQVAYALENGFAGIAVDPYAITTSEAARAELLRRAEQLWASGSDVLLYTPPKLSDGPRVHGPDLGVALGSVTSRIVRSVGVRRLVVAGGDTSGLVARALGIIALRMIAPVAPGSPLCVATSDDPLIDGLEIALKGGQVGCKEYFVDVAARDGSGPKETTTKGENEP